MNKAMKVVAVTVAVGGLVAGGWAARCHFAGSCALKRHAQLDPAKRAGLARDFLTVSREHDSTAVRGWLMQQGAEVSAQVLLSLDNTIDQSGAARLSALNTIYSLGSEDLSDESLHAWAEILRTLAAGMLHEGPERSDYVAKSFIMEGRDRDAASEYERFPKSAGAALFFQQNPFLRKPASN